MKLNSIVAFQDVETKKWEFDVRYELMTVRGTSSSDSLAFDCYRSACYFATGNGRTMRMFESCPYNYRVVNSGSLADKGC